MSAPLRRNPRRQCRPTPPTLGPPVSISIRGHLFNEIINKLRCREAKLLQTELHRLLNCQACHAHHLCIVNIITVLQRKLQSNPKTRQFNYQLLIPVPQFRGQLRNHGPGYATGNL